MEDKVNKNSSLGLDQEQKVDGVDLMQMFSLAKKMSAGVPLLGKRSSSVDIDEIVRNQLQMLEDGKKSI
jgi:hypothetical protein